MADHPKISVIMSVFNGEKYLREAIDSILSQSYTDFEFIIVNDGSTDNSPSIIKSYSDKRIRLIDNEQNIGLTKSLNRAIKQGRGEYIARQDVDDISLPQRLEEQVKYLEQHPEIVALGTSRYVIDEDGKIMRKEAALLKPGHNLFQANAFTHGSVMFRKAVIDELGGYNEVFRYSQDYELWLRVAQHHQIRNLPQVLYKLRSHGANIRLQHWEEATLYHLLALKVARNEAGDRMLAAIKKKGIKSLVLGKSEAVFFHRAMASLAVRQGNLKGARKEYLKVFHLAPFAIKNNVNIIGSYLGWGVMLRMGRLYEATRNLGVYLGNRFAR